MLKQRTLKTVVTATGVGLHSGQRVELTLRPAPPDSGIVFRRVDLAVPVEIPVRCDAVSDTRMASTISAGIETIGPNFASVAVVMRATQNTPNKPAQATVLGLRVTLTKQDDRWLVMDVTPIASR